MAIPLPKTPHHADVAAGRPMTPLEAAIEQVDEASREVLSLVGQLADRLEPVLLPASVESVPEKGAVVGPVHSPAVLCLQSRADFLRSVRDDLQRLLDRVEV